MKLISWNVNGIRAVLKKGFLEFVSSENPDIISIQETKAHPDQVDEILKEFPHHFWNSAEKKGYSGVAVFSKIKPLNVKEGIGILDNEGRVLTLEFENFFLVNVYSPNSKPDLSRVDLRHDKWDKALLRHIKELEKKNPVILCGDLNVAHKEIDIARPSANKTTETRPGSAGFTDKERKGFQNFIDSNIIDTFRFKNKEKVQYSWWSYRAIGARKNNIGWRIDYFLVSASLKEKIKEAKILDDIIGSDHCPISLIIS